nr:E6 protein [human papillomavirus 108]
MYIKDTQDGASSFLFGHGRLRVFVRGNEYCTIFITRVANIFVLCICYYCIVYVKNIFIFRHYGIIWDCVSIVHRYCVCTSNI